MSVGTFRIVGGPYATPEVDPVDMTNEQFIQNGKAQIERRAAARTDLAAIWTADERTANRAMNLAQDVKTLRETCEEWEQTAKTLLDENKLLRAENEARQLIVNHQAQQLDRLIAEARRLLTVVHKQAIALAQSDYRHKTKGEPHATH